MIDELNRLRADLEVLERYNQSICLDDIKRVIRDKIARLEEAESDPWRKAKESIDHWRSCGMWPDITGLYDHLTAELAEKERRIDELEAMDEFRLDPETGTLEVDHVGPEPTLDPARVLATAVAMMRETGYKGNEMIYAMSHASKDAKPYRLKGGEDE